MEWTMGGVQPLQMKVAHAKEALLVATPACESAQTLPRPCLDPAQTLRITFAARSLEEVTESNPIILWYRPLRLHSFESHETTSPPYLPTLPLSLLAFLLVLALLLVLAILYIRHNCTMLGDLGFDGNPPGDCVCPLPSHPQALTF